jgi:hypothetical protein
MGSTFRELIALRKRELDSQRTALRAQLARIDAEIAEIERAEQSLLAAEDQSAPLNLGVTFPAGSVPNIPQANSAASVLGSFGRLAEIGRSTLSAYENMTIKQLVMQALRDKHPKALDTSDLRTFIHEAYGRSIEPNSLRPQLSRLKAEYWIEQSPLGSWRLTKMATRLREASMNVADEPAEPSALADPSAPSDEELAREIEAAGLLGQISIEQWRRHRPWKK